MTTLADGAMRYATAGIPTFPCHWPYREGDRHVRCSCRAGPSCSRMGKHPLTRRGLRDATTDRQRVQGWWRRWPQANVGLVTGALFDVLDVDGPRGLAAVRDLVEDPAVWLAVPTVRTGSGGWHAYLRPSGAGNRAHLLDEVDYRGVGGYVIAPPSLHASGGRYRWARPLDLAGLPEPPPRLRDLLLKERSQSRQVAPAVDSLGYGPAALHAELDRLMSATPGGKGGTGRNDLLNRTAFRCYQLAHAGLLDHSEVTERFRVAALALGLGEAEIDATLRSAAAGAARHPREIKVRGVRRNPVPDRSHGGIHR